MPPKRSAKSTSRKDTPVSPAKPASSTGSPKQTRRSARGGRNDDELEAQRGSVELSLQPVAEANEEDSIEVDPGPAAAESSSEYSSDTNIKLNALDFDDVVDSLTDLHRESSNVIQFFSNHTPESLTALYAELQDPSSKPSGRLRRMLGKYIFTRQPFGSEPFVNTSVIARKLQNGEAGIDLMDGNWRPDAIVYLANLAQTLATAFSGVEDQMDEFFRDLHTGSLHHFASSEPTSRFCTKSTEQLVEFLIAVRTQYFIHVTHHRGKQANFDPDELLNELFFERGMNRLSEIPGLAYQSDAVDRRILEIKKFVTTNSRNPVKIDQLQKAFPWTDFLLQVYQWASVRRQELEAQIAVQGGMDYIVDHIRNQDFVPPLHGVAEAAAAQAALDEALPIDPQLTQGTTPARKGNLPTRLSGQELQGEIAYVKSLRAAKAAQNATRTGSKALTPRRGKQKQQEISESEVEVDAPGEPDVPYDDGPPPFDDTELLRPSQMTHLVEGTIAAHAQESNKENRQGLTAPQKSFLDRQANARKVLFDGTSPGKRRRGQEVDEDEDDDFEQDERPAKQSRKSKGKGRADVELVQSSTQPAPTRVPLRPVSTSASRLPPSSAPAAFQNIDDQKYDDPADRYAAANMRAKENVQERRQASLNQQVQVRRAWSDSEVRRLMELIEINGSKYSKILQDDKDASIYPDGPVLQARSQVQLKDKARNMKLDFLK
jgi:hypothetical protein